MLPDLAIKIPVKKEKKPEGPKLVLAHNSKTKFSSNHKNTFGLTFGLPVNGGTCPGATSGPGGCLDKREGKRETCYMAKVCQIYKGVKPTLEVNTQLLRNKSEVEMIEILSNTFESFKVGNKREHWFFRLTYSGDVFSEDLARAIAASCVKFPEIQFWMYTRSHDYVDLLSQAKNLAVYLSIDPVNKVKGYETYQRLISRNNVGLAWLGDPLKEEPYRFVSCPETSGKIKNSETAGACSKCRLCFRYSDSIKLRNIKFNIH